MYSNLTISYDPIDRPEVRRMIGHRPEHIPESYAIHMGIHPLVGDMLWKEGDYFYAAIAPYWTMSSWMYYQNLISHAVEVEYVSPEVAITEQLEYYSHLSARLVEELDRSDEETRLKLMAGWRMRENKARMLKNVNARFQAGG